MTQHHRTLDSELLQGLFQNDQGVSRLLEQLLNQVLKAELTEHLGAHLYERNEERQGQRNGFYDRELVTGLAP